MPDPVRIEARRAGSAAAVVAGAALATLSSLAAADLERGAALFEQHCAVCHSLLPGHHQEGPSLHAIYGRPAGRAPLYTRYRGLAGAEVVWSEETLDAWLADPRAFLGGRDTGMTLKLADPAVRADIIAFLKDSR